MIVVALMVVFPPIGPHYVHWDGFDLQGHRISGLHTEYYGFLIEDYTYIRYGFLAIQQLAVVGIVGNFIYILRDKRPKE